MVVLVELVEFNANSFETGKVSSNSDRKLFLMNS